MRLAPKESPMPSWVRRQWQKAPRYVLTAVALGFVCCLPAHLAYTQYALRRDAIQALIGDAQSRAGLAAVFLSDRRDEVHKLVESGGLQRPAVRQAEGTDGLDAVGESLREFGREHSLGSKPCFALLVFLSKSGAVRSEAVPGAPPVLLTFDTLKSLAQNSYIRPTYLTLGVRGSGDILLLSVAVFSAGVVQGQLLAVLNPEAVDNCMQDAPAFAHRSVYLVSQQDEVYAPRGSPMEWRTDVVALRSAGPDKKVSLHLGSAPGRTTSAGPGLAVRAHLPASEFSLVCVEPGAAIPTVGGIVRTALLYLGVGVGLLALAFHGRGLYSRLLGGSAGDPAERVTEEQSQGFLALFEHLPDSLLLADLEGGVHCLNRAMQIRTGSDAESLRGKPVKALLGEVLDEADRGVLNRALQGRQPWYGRMRNPRLDGTTLTAETAVFPVLGRNGRPAGIVVLQRDVTAEVQMGDRLRQAQKMEAVGVLTDGIAHDFNNLLTVIQGNCSLLLGGTDSLDSFARDNIDEILRACDRAAAMTRRLLSFSRHKGIQLEIVDLNEVVGSTEKMLSRLIRENVDMSLMLAAEPVLVKADIVQLEQVIINLTVNARDAMPRGGRLTVRVGRRSITTRAAGIHLEEGEYAVLAVEDTGHGMDEMTRRRIFEPFFTTKAEHEGTGLGLTTVQSIVKDHGGAVTVQSQVGLGTAFTVWLPRYTEPRLPPEVSSERTTLTLDADTEIVLPASGAQSRSRADVGILLLDDEESVLRMIERGLVTKGFKVFAARTDIELLMKWEEHRDEVDLLITDMVMPGMSGVEVAERLRQDRPELKVLSISAYTDSVIMKLGGTGCDDTLFLQKPFTPDVLIAKVERMLSISPAE